MPPGIAVEIVKPLAGAMGADAGKWTVRLTTGLATAAQIATIVGFMLAHPPGGPTDPHATMPKPDRCEITLTRSQTQMHAQFPCQPDSPELTKAIVDFVAKNGQPDKVQVKHVPPHHKAK
jgi:hypothetical protein